MPWSLGGVEAGELLTAVVIVLLGMLSVALIVAILGDTTSLYSTTSIVFMVLLAGAALGLLPWGFLASETLWGRVLLMYLTSAFIAGAIAFVMISPVYAQSYIPAALVGLAGGGTYYQYGGADHVLFIPTWVCLLGVYLLGIAGLGRAVFMVENLLPVLAGVGATVVIVATHQALIRERSRYLSSG